MLLYTKVIYQFYTVYTVLHINLSAQQLQTQLFGAYLPPGEMLKDMIRLVAAEAHRTTTFTGGGWWKGVHFEWVFPLDVDAEAKQK